jgi:hypothetical protein
MGFEIFYNIGIGLAMILGTFIFHAYTLDRLIRVIQPFVMQAKSTSRQIRHFSRAMVLLMTSLGVICILSAEIWFWAFLYLYLDLHAVHDLETALYFSLVSFTTVGYGDIVLSPNDRLLGGMQATAGMLLFGWSTAFMFEVLSAVYAHHRVRDWIKDDPKSPPRHD